MDEEEERDKKRRSFEEMKKKNRHVLAMRVFLSQLCVSVCLCIYKINPEHLSEKCTEKEQMHCIWSDRCFISSICFHSACTFVKQSDVCVYFAVLKGQNHPQK